MSTAGHPDWTPAIRGYAAGMVQAETTETVNAGATNNHTLEAPALYDVNVVQAYLPTNCGVWIRSFDDVGEFLDGAMIVNPYPAPFVVHLPVRNQANIVQVFLQNFDPVNHDVTWAVRGYNGIPLDELRQPPASGWLQAIGSTVGVFSPGPQVPSLAVYDRLAWVATGDRSFDVVARATFPQGGVVATFDTVLASLPNPGTMTGELAVGAVGLQLGLVNTAAGTLVGSMTIRAWHDG